MTIRALALTVLLLSSFAMSACGLTPVYGDYSDTAKGSPVSSALSSVYIDNIPDRTGQRLKNALMDHMYKHGRPGVSAKYRLQVNPVIESIYGLGIAKDATATRSQIRLGTTMYLYDAQTGERLFARAVKSISSFNTLSSQYTTLVTEDDARIQAIEDLANQIETQLELYFSNPSAFPTEEEINEKLRADQERGPIADRQSIDWSERDPTPAGQ